MKPNIVLNGISFGIMIVMLLVIIYHPITSLGFANMDDKWMLIGDKMVHPTDVSFRYLAVLFTSFNEVQYSPANTLYYHSVFLINGYDPYWYHICGFIIHLLNVALVYLFIKQILKLFDNSGASITACICCTLWAVHPFNVESVIWVSASKVLISTTFTLISLLAILRFALSKSKIYYIISLVSFIIACFCKEQALILPVTLVAFLLIFRSTLCDISIKYWLKACIPFFLIAFVFGIVTVIAQQTAYGANEPASLYNFFDRLVFSFYCLCFYLFNTVIPINLHYQYNFPMKPGQALPILYYIFPIAFLLIISFFIYFLKNQSQRNLYFFWLLFFLINIILCIQIVPMRRPAIMADRYMYLPLLGLMVPLIVAIGDFGKKSKSKDAAVINISLCGIGMAYLIFFIITSNQMAANWQHYNLITK